MKNNVAVRRSDDENSSKGKAKKVKKAAKPETTGWLDQSDLLLEILEENDAAKN